MIIAICMTIALGIAALSCLFFKNGRTKRFARDYSPGKTFGGGAGEAESPAEKPFSGDWGDKFQLASSSEGL